MASMLGFMKEIFEKAILFLQEINCVFYNVIYAIFCHDNKELIINVPIYLSVRNWLFLHVTIK